MFPHFSDLFNTLSRQLTVLYTQGYDITDLSAQLEALPDSYDAIHSFAKEIVSSISKRPDYPYNEPDSLADILFESPNRKKIIKKPSNSGYSLRDRIAGAVHGRIAGCILGKPFEMGLKLPEIRTYLKGTGNWMLTDFVPDYSPTQTRNLRRDCLESMKGHIQYAQEDDDINYFVVGLLVLEQYGSSFSSSDVARMWLKCLPYNWCWGSEREFYCRLTSLYPDQEQELILPENQELLQFTSLFNTGEEMIGAMIRADAYGLANPGNPEKAAKTAWCDAIMTHKKTGLYASMWVAGTIAAALYLDNPIEAIECGLEQIPANSRFAECVRTSLAWALADKDWLNTWEKIEERWGYLGHAGTMNETAAIVNALVHSIGESGQVEFQKAICITVMQGYDTDCSGATAGCIAGALIGLSQLPNRWIKPFNDTFYSSVAGYRGTSIIELSERMYAVSEKNDDFNVIG